MAGQLISAETIVASHGLETPPSTSLLRSPRETQNFIAAFMIVWLTFIIIPSGIIPS